MKVATIVVDETQSPTTINFYGNMQPNEALAYAQRLVIVQEARRVREEGDSPEQSVESPDNS
jgi:hypothetical protein